MGWTAPVTGQPYGAQTALISCSREEINNSMVRVRSVSMATWSKINSGFLGPYPRRRPFSFLLPAEKSPGILLACQCRRRCTGWWTNSHTETGRKQLQKKAGPVKKGCSSIYEAKPMWPVGPSNLDTEAIEEAEPDVYQSKASTYITSTTCTPAHWLDTGSLCI